MYKGVQFFPFFPIVMTVSVDLLVNLHDMDTLRQDADDILVKERKMLLVIICKTLMEKKAESAAHSLCPHGALMFQVYLDMQTIKTMFA